MVIKMTATLKIGDPIRSRHSINYGTLGFFCMKGNTILFATCDHVINFNSIFNNDPESKKIYFPWGDQFQNKIGIYEDLHLIDENNKIADFALVKPLIDVPSYTFLPATIPSSKIVHIQKVGNPVVGMEVYLWGSRTKTYLSGVIIQKNSSYSWPHPIYGIVQYKHQFAVAVTSQYIPDIGDSGGYVITPNGTLIGIIAALSGVISEAGNAIIHCVPVKECCDLLNVQPITQSLIG